MRNKTGKAWLVRGAWCARSSICEIRLSWLIVALHIVAKVIVAQIWTQAIGIHVFQISVPESATDPKFKLDS